jgi:hypothetical protein
MFVGLDRLQGAILTREHEELKLKSQMLDMYRYMDNVVSVAKGGCCEAVALIALG